MVDWTLLDSLFEKIVKHAPSLEKSEKRQILRTLRLLYFYPDEILKELRIIVATNADDPDSSIARAGPWMDKIPQFDSLLSLLRSESISTNLHLSITEIEELRRIADYKEGIRGYLNSIFFVWTFQKDREGIVELATEALNDIEKFNCRLRSLDHRLKQRMRNT